MNKKGLALPAMVLGSILFIGLISGVYYLGIQKGQTTLQTIFSKTIYVNFSSFGDDESLDYFKGQITAPNNYYATDDSMLTSYSSQGGMAPPRVILMKNYQVLNSKYEDDYYKEVTSRKENDCIVIWSTNGFLSIDNWNESITGFKGELINKEDFSVESRMAVIYEMVRNEGNIYVGLLPIGNKLDTTYYFHTCNTHNKSDFIDVIKSIKFRKDLKF